MAIGTLGDHETRKVEAFYAHLIARLGRSQRAQCVVVAHVLPDAPAFLGALNQVATIRLLLAKPKSLESASGRRVVSQLPYRRLPLSRGWSSTPPRVLADIEEALEPDTPFVLCDIGGYFAKLVDTVAHHFGDQFLGVLEGTENGAAVYESHFANIGEVPPVPIMSVARSPLKLPEDFLVGAGIVFSVEAILRDHGQVLQTRTATVIGFGRVGRAVAEALRVRGVPTVIYDIDPTSCAEASVRGYPVYSRLEDAISFGTLVVSATGAGALNQVALKALRRGAVVATVTSRDSEFDETYLEHHFVEEIDEAASHGMSLYREAAGDREFWLVNNGNAPNFVHGAVLGPAFHLISGEKLSAVHRLINYPPARSVTPEAPLAEIDADLRRKVASTWNEHFIAIR